MSRREPQSTPSTTTRADAAARPRRATSVGRVTRRVFSGALCVLFALLGALFVASPVGPGGIVPAASSEAGGGAPVPVTGVPGTETARVAALAAGGDVRTRGARGPDGARRATVSTDPATCPVVETALTASDLNGHAGVVGTSTGTEQCLQPVPATAGSSGGVGAGDVSNNALIDGTGMAAVSQTIGISIMPAPSPVP